MQLIHARILDQRSNQSLVFCDIKTFTTFDRQLGHRLFLNRVSASASTKLTPDLVVLISHPKLFPE
jgi:hypothetical protein